MLVNYMLMGMETVMPENTVKVKVVAFVSTLTESTKMEKLLRDTGLQDMLVMV